MKKDNIRLIEEYGDDLDKLCDGFLEAREKIEEHEKTIEKLESEIESFEDDLRNE